MPRLFENQIKALLHASKNYPNQVKIMFPMIENFKQYQELKKKAQPFLDALEIASERVRAFLDVVLSRGKETQEHKQSARRRGHDMEH